MPIVMFLFLLARRAIASVVVLPVSSFVLFVTLLFLSLLVGRRTADFINTQIYQHWIGVIVFYLLLMAVCAGIDHVTGSLEAFALVPPTLRLVGCTAVTLVLTIVLTALAGPTTGRQAHPDWCEFNVMPPEIYLLSPLFMSEVLSLIVMSKKHHLKQAPVLAWEFVINRGAT